MPRKKRALLMTVGTGTGDKRCSLAHGLMCSIDSKDPDFICFFVSKDSKPTVDALKKVFNNKFDEDFDECYDYEFVENEAVDKFTEYFNEFKSKISELEDDYRILIDYTSGTKTMTMAAAFASMIFRKELFFVSGKREKGIVVKGTEECVPQNLYQVYDELMINKIKDLLIIIVLKLEKYLLMKLLILMKIKKYFLNYLMHIIILIVLIMKKHLKYLILRNFKRLGQI